MQFNELIKKGREKLGVTLEVAAKEFGMSVAYLSDFEQGRANKPKIDFIYKAANFYGIDADTLCISADKLPKDIWFKIVGNPKMFAAIRNL